MLDNEDWIAGTPGGPDSMGGLLLPDLLEIKTFALGFDDWLNQVWPTPDKCDHSPDEHCSCER